VLTSNKRIIETDKKVASDVTNQRFINRLFTRLVAKQKTFSNVDFRYSIFDSCYLRDCNFESCDFTGCKFAGSNLYGSQFIGCTFNYAVFERTYVSDEILESGAPSVENLQARFARTLRMNFQQVGESRAANRAMSIELRATEVHLRKAWQARESYYFKKYRGWKQVPMFFEWTSFKLLDLIWGNGESAWKLVRFAALIFFVMALIDITIDKTKNPWMVASYTKAIVESPEVFFGVISPPEYAPWYLTLIMVVRLITVGFFLSIILKRFNRR